MTSAAATHKTGIVLDIDDTLSDTARTCMKLMATELGFPMTETTAALIRKYQQPHFVPQWQNNEGEKWLEQHLLDPDFLITLPVIKDAIDALPRIHSMLPISLYLTSRDSRMQDVTQAWLSAVGAPAAPLVTRPIEVIDPSWKIKLLSEKYPEAQVFIDNEIHLPETYTSPAHILQIQPYQEKNNADPRVINFHHWSELEKWLSQHY